MKSNFKGITHYQELYDQSKYFDNSLTRYYTKKGWNIFQFSLLRSLSEILILKILVSRYPELQTNQVSCHAAHVRNGRAYPCGNCEKCRRIIALIEVLGFSAERCGYSRDQITKAFAEIGKKGVKQLETDAAHLINLLIEKNLIDRTSEIAKLAKSHHYIMKLNDGFEEITGTITIVR